MKHQYLALALAAVLAVTGVFVIAGADDTEAAVPSFTIEQGGTATLTGIDLSDYSASEFEVGLVCPSAAYFSTVSWNSTSLTVSVSGFCPAGTYDASVCASSIENPEISASIDCKVTVTEAVTELVQKHTLAVGQAVNLLIVDMSKYTRIDSHIGTFDDTGLSFSETTGRLTGTPSTAGSYSLYVVAWINDDKYTITASLTVSQPTSYTATFITNGGTACSPITVAANASGTLPTTTREGYNFLGWYLSADSTNKFGDAGDSFTLNINTKYYAHWEEAVQLSFQSPPVLDIIAGGTFSYSPATNLASSVTLTSAPSWLTFADGKLGGTAPTVTAVSAASAVLTAVSGTQTAVQNLSFNIYPVVQISGANTASLIAGDAMPALSLTCNLDCTWTLTGALPDGVTFSNGTFSGTPAAGTAGSYPVTVVAAASEGPEQSASILVTLTVTKQLEVVSSFPVTDFVAGYLYSYSPVAGLEGASWSLTDGPDWLIWDAATSSVRGTVPSYITETTSVSYALTARTSAPDQTASQTVTVSILPVLKFTTIPTAAMIVTPVYNYGSDGVPIAANLLFAFADTSSAADTMTVAAQTATYKFTFVGEQATYIVWDFGDGNTSSEWSPTHTYAEDGTYTVRCTAINDLGTSFTEQELTVECGHHVLPGWAWFGLIAVCLLLAALVLLWLRSRRYDGRPEY